MVTLLNLKPSSCLTWSQYYKICFRRTVVTSVPYQMDPLLEDMFWRALQLFWFFNKQLPLNSWRVHVTCVTILTHIMLSHLTSIFGCKTFKYQRKLESASSKRRNFWVTESSLTFCFNCVKSIWNKEQNVSRSTYPISKYGKCLSSFFDSFEMSLSKRNFRCFLSFSGTMLIFLYFSIFTINSYCCRLYDASEIFL